MIGCILKITSAKLLHFFLLFVVASVGCSGTSSGASEPESSANVKSEGEGATSVAQGSAAEEAAGQSAVNERKKEPSLSSEKAAKPEPKLSTPKPSTVVADGHGSNAAELAAKTAVADKEEKADSNPEGSGSQHPIKKTVSLEDLLKAPSDVASPPDDAADTPSGLVSKVLKPGKGKRKPKVSDSVQVNYTGWQTSGRMFDSSWKRGTPATFPLGHVIEGWTEGVQLMVEGEKRRFWIPEALAYKGKPGAPSGMLVFDIELLKIINVPVAPADVAEPPNDSDKRESGLATKLLKPGIGDIKPATTSTVTLHFTGWTTEGVMFDSSVARGVPAVLPLNRGIPGWTEGIALMVEGERRRFWVPEHLAYKGRPGAPAGMLVFDIELIKIDP
jgi:peptidylprolyl isomerase